MPSGRGDLERPLGALLAFDLGQVAVGIGFGGRRAVGTDRVQQAFAVQMIDQRQEVRHAVHGHAVDQSGLPRVGGRHEQPPAAPAGQLGRDRQDAADRLEFPAERKFPQEPVAGRRDRDLLGRGQDPDRDRQVESGSLLAQVGGSQVDRDPLRRQGASGRADRRPDPLPALPDRLVGQSDHGQPGQPGSHVDFREHRHDVQSDQGGGGDGRDHAYMVARLS